MPDEMLDSTEAHDLRLNADLMDDDDFTDRLGDFSLGELSGVLADPALAAGGVLEADESAWLLTTGTGRGNPSVMSGGGGPGKRRPPYESSAEDDPGE